MPFLVLACGRSPWLNLARCAVLGRRLTHCMGAAAWYSARSTPLTPVPKLPRPLPPPPPIPSPPLLTHVQPPSGGQPKPGPGPKPRQRPGHVCRRPAGRGRAPGPGRGRGRGRRQQRSCGRQQHPSLKRGGPAADRGRGGGGGDAGGVAGTLLGESMVGAGRVCSCVWAWVSVTVVKECVHAWVGGRQCGGAAGQGGKGRLGGGEVRGLGQEAWACRRLTGGGGAHNPLQSGSAR